MTNKLTGELLYRETIADKEYVGFVLRLDERRYLADVHEIPFGRALFTEAYLQEFDDVERAREFVEHTWFNYIETKK